MNVKLSAVVLALLTMMSVACSVKEKRCDCPCYLMMDFSKVDSVSVPSVSIGMHSADGFQKTMELGCEKYGRPLVVEVPRSDIFINAVSDDRGLFGAHGLVIPQGEQCPPLYMHSSKVNTEKDTVTDTVVLHKNYCALSVGMIADGKSQPFQIGVKGNVCGYEDDGRPMGGDFLVIHSLPAGNLDVINLPRQKDSSLSLQILDDGQVVREFALGEYMVSSGYDWTAPDLEDVEVKVDFALAEVAIRINEWETRYVYGVEI